MLNECVGFGAGVGRLTLGRGAAVGAGGGGINGFATLTLLLLVGGR